MFARLAAIYFLTVVVLALGGIAAWQHHYIAELSGAIGVAETDIDTLKADLDKTKQQLATERQAGDAAHYRLQVEKDEAAKAISSLKGQLVGLEGDLADVRTKLSAEQESSAAAKRLSERSAAEREAAEKAAAARSAVKEAAPEAARAVETEPAKEGGQAKDAQGSPADREAALGAPDAPAADAKADTVPAEQKPAEQKPGKEKDALADPPATAAQPAEPATANGASDTKKPDAKADASKPKKTAKRKKKPAADSSYFSF